MRLAPAPEEPEEPGQFWKDFIRDTAPVFRETHARAAGQLHRADLAGAGRRRPLRRRAAGRDLRRAGPRRDRRGQRLRVPGDPRQRPAVGADRLLQPARASRPGDPAAVLGPARRVIDADWAEFHAEYAAQIGELQAGFSAFCVERGASPLPMPEMIHESPWLNLMLYPAELDYRRRRALPPTWHNLETSVRATDPGWEPPGGDGPLIYVSLGSLGSGDVALMRRLVDALSRTPYRYVVSTGPQHARIRAGRQHDRGGVPAPGVRPPARRCGDHARRQQHDDGVHVVRHPDAGAADLLGSARQRPTRARDRLRAAAADVLVRRRSARRRSGHAPARTRQSARGPPRPARACNGGRERRWPPT